MAGAKRIDGGRIACCAQTTPGRRLARALKGDVLKDWLTRWMSELDTPQNMFPLSATSRRVGFTQRHIMMAAAVACICLACCVGHGMWFDQPGKTALAERECRRSTEAGNGRIEKIRPAGSRRKLAKARTANDQ